MRAARIARPLAIAPDSAIGPSNQARVSSTKASGEIVPAWQAPPSEIDAFVRDELMIEARARRLEELLDELAEHDPPDLRKDLL